MIEGDHLEGKIVYLDRSNKIRADEDFTRKINEDHHVGRSVLEDVPRLDMISFSGGADAFTVSLSYSKNDRVLVERT